MELHYRTLSLYGEKIANTAFDRFLPFCMSFSDEEIKEANQLKLINKKRKLSYIDCLGYIIARKRNTKFLTGNIQFKDLKSVEFIK